MSHLANYQIRQINPCDSPFRPADLTEKMARKTSKSAFISTWGGTASSSTQPQTKATAVTSPKVSSRPPLVPNVFNRELRKSASQELKKSESQDFERSTAENKQQNSSSSRKFTRSRTAEKNRPGYNRSRSTGRPAVSIMGSLIQRRTQFFDRKNSQGEINRSFSSTFYDQNE